MRGLIVLILLFWVLPAVIKKLKTGKAGKQAEKSAAKPAAAQRQTPSVEMHRPVPSMQRKSPSVTHTAHRDFSAPEAPCIVCENTGEDHFQRDKVRRIKQLDDWLKSGLIDREEYRVLKDRYQRGI